MNRFFRSCIITTSLLPLIASQAWAQAPRPNAAEPGRTDRLRAPVQRPALTNKPLVDVPQTKSAPLKGGSSFVLNDLSVSNATAFSAEELREVYKDYIGKQVTLSTLNEITSKITSHYRNAGYILSSAVISPQRIKGGKVVANAIEGHIDQVIFQGNKTESSLLNSYAEKIRASAPLNSADLERYLLLMEDLPGVVARATLRPSAKKSGASDVIVTLEEKPVNVTVTADNRGTRFLGQGQASITAAINNMFGGLYEKTQVRFLNTTDLDELHYGELRHEQQLDSEGTKLALSGAFTRSESGHTLKNFGVIGRDLLLTAEVTHPFIRSRETNLNGNLLFDRRNTRVETLGANLYEDRLHVLRMGGSYDFVDQYFGVNRFDGEISKGFGWDDDSSTGIRSRTAGRTSFVKATAEASHIQPITNDVSILVSGMGQLSARSLLSSEQFGVGGANYGSAYDPSEISGDSGIAGRTELQYSRRGDSELIPTYQTYGFYDIGKAWSRRPGAGQNKEQSLASVGVGLRFNSSEAVSGGLELSFPLTRRVGANGQDGSAPRLFFNLAYQY